MNLLATSVSPVPAGAISGTLRASDGVTLRFARFLPVAGRKGTVCVFPGRAEFIEKYFEVIEELRARGFAVALLDWRGQGLSERALRDPRKGHVRNFAEYDRDLEVFMREAVLPDCPPPYFALAHSMGGSILIRAAAQGRTWFDRTVTTGAMIGLAGAGGALAARVAARVLRGVGAGSAYVPSGGATSIFSQPFEGNPLTSDPIRFARTARFVEEHPQLTLGSPTVGWLAAAYDTMEEFADPRMAQRLRHPFLMVVAGDDRVVDSAAIERFSVRLRAGAHVVIRNARHEIMMERDEYRAQFWAAFDAFVPGTPAF